MPSSNVAEAECKHDRVDWLRFIDFGQECVTVWSLLELGCKHNHDELASFSPLGGGAWWVCSRFGAKVWVIRTIDTFQITRCSVRAGYSLDFGRPTVCTDGHSVAQTWRLFGRLKIRFSACDPGLGRPTRKPGSWSLQGGPWSVARGQEFKKEKRGDQTAV